MLTQLLAETVNGMLKAWAEFVQEPEPISQTVEEVTEMPAQTYHE
jgi:hypothetical protein